MKLLWTAAVAAALFGRAVNAQLPSGFEEQEVLDSGTLGGGVITDFAFTPTGSLIVIKKEGGIVVFDDPAGDQSFTQKTNALDLTPYVCANSERGVEGIEVHPDFETNRYIFVYYTYNKNGNCDEDPFNGPVNRLSRFVLPVNNLIDINTETVFFETPPLEYDHHNSGDIAFGNDGHIYVSVGDGGSTFSGVSSNPGNLLGSIVRLTADGSIPSDNPYTFESGEANSVRCNVTGIPPPGSPAGAKCQEIFALGLRNPFRFAMDPNTAADTVRFLVNDVGQAKWEEVSEGGTDFIGAHYGWPAREGPCPNSQVRVCAGAHPYEDPIHFYIHNPDLGGGAVTGGAIVPNGVWPAEYDGVYMYGDYVYGTIYMMKDTGTPACIACDPPTSGMEVTPFTTYYRILTVKFGPYAGSQALYYSGIPGAIRRIVYVGSGNRSPTAVAVADPTEGPVGVTVSFVGAGSSDSDGDPLSFEWDFNGDGIVDSTSADAVYKYNTAGLFVATLTVSDGNGGSTVTKVEISVGNKPVPTITSPAEGATFAVGDVFTLTGFATDVETNGNLPDTALSWEVRQHHDTHYHPFLDLTQGNNIVISPAPEPEDYEAAGNSYLEIILTATDSDGLSTTVSRTVQPRIVNIDFDTIPSGLEIFLDGNRFSTPGTAISWEGHSLKVDAPDQFLDGQAYVFSSWTNGGQQSQTIPIPPAGPTNPKVVAEFTPFTGTFAPTMAPTETFRCVPGFLGIATEQVFTAGSTYENEDYDVVSRLQSDGNLVVRRGNGDLVWESGVSGSASNYYAFMQQDSNFIIWEGTPENRGDVHWKTDTRNAQGDYFFGIDCYSQVVSVYKGRYTLPGESIWNSAPTPAPITPTVAPTASPPPTAFVTPPPTSPIAPPTEFAPPVEGPPVEGPATDGGSQQTTTSSSSVMSLVVGLVMPFAAVLPWLS